MIDLERRLRASKREFEGLDLLSTLNDMKNRIKEKILVELEDFPKSSTMGKEGKINHQYAEELRKQILEKQEKDLTEKKYQRIPGISSDLNGYPSIIQASVEEMHEIKQKQREAFKRELDIQVRSKKTRKNHEKLRDLEYDKNYISNANESLKNEMNSAIKTKLKQARILNNTWSQAAMLKKLKDIDEGITRKGCNQSLLKKMFERKNTKMKKIASEYLETVNSVLKPNNSVDLSSSQESIEDISPAKNKAEDLSVVTKIDTRVPKMDIIAPKIDAEVKGRVHYKSYNHILDSESKIVKKFPPYPKPLKKVKLAPLLNLR